MTRALAALTALALVAAACGGGGGATTTSEPAATAATKSDTSESGNTVQVATAAPATTTGADEGAIDRAMLGTVQIGILDAANQLTGMCSGTNFHPAGYILTNWHCVGVPARAGGSLPAGMRYHPQGYVVIAPTTDAREAPSPTYVAQLVTGSPDLDIAVVKIIDTLGRGTSLPQKLALPVVPSGNSERVKLGDKAIVIGYPAAGGAFITRAAGTVAGFADRNDDGKPDSFKTDVKSGAGVSGGLLINERGEQIGIPVGTSGVQAAGDVFLAAIFIDLAKPFMDQAVAAAGATVGPPSRSITLPGTSPVTSGARPTATPRVTPTPRPTATATATRSPGATATPRPTGTPATGGTVPTGAKQVILGGQIVDADTKRPIAGAIYAILQEGVTPEQFEAADDKDSLVITYAESDADGVFILEPVDKGKTYYTLAGHPEYTIRWGKLGIPSNAPDVARLQTIELKQK